MASQLVREGVGQAFRVGLGCLSTKSLFQISGFPATPLKAIPTRNPSAPASAKRACLPAGTNHVSFS